MVMHLIGRRRLAAGVGIGILVLLTCACRPTPPGVAPAGGKRSDESNSNVTRGDVPSRNVSAGGAAHPASDAQLVSQVELFCGNCHAMPKAESFSREHWAREVQRGFDFYFASGRADLPVPRAADVRRYFEAGSPQGLKLPHPASLDHAAAGRFQTPAVPPPVVPSTAGQPPTGRIKAVAAAAVTVSSWPGLELPQMMLADMRSGAILAGPAESVPSEPLQTVAELKHPCRFVQCELDGDNQPGLLVADLGSFLPADHAQGRVVWLRRVTDNLDGLAFEPVTILEGCGRVADVQVADIDGDGDLDIVVSDFGWHETGRLLWLERISAGPVEAASFQLHVLDERPGTLETTVVDLNGDGRLDVVALIAQEFETIVAFINQGADGFHLRELYAADDPAFGSSGMVLCDLDQDGDLDIVYTNGDSFDSFEVKPYHAVHWLENTGDLTFRPRELAQLPGVHRALPVDLDQDGDLDIVACTFLPRDMRTVFASAEPMALVWLENLGGGEFRLRPLQVGTCTHPALFVGDINGDGLPDIAAANFYEDEFPAGPPVDLWLSVPSVSGDR
jgi:hypothetical protein